MLFLLLLLNGLLFAVLVSDAVYLAILGHIIGLHLVPCLRVDTPVFAVMVLTRIEPMPPVALGGPAFFGIPRFHFGGHRESVVLDRTANSAALRVGLVPLLVGARYPARTCHHGGGKEEETDHHRPVHALVLCVLVSAVWCCAVCCEVR